MPLSQGDGDELGDPGARLSSSVEQDALLLQTGPGRPQGRQHTSQRDAGGAYTAWHDSTLRTVAAQATEGWRGTCMAALCANDEARSHAEVGGWLHLSTHPLIQGPVRCKCALMPITNRITNILILAG